MSYVYVCVLGFVCECPTSWSILTIRAKEVLAQWSLFVCQNNTSSHLSGTEKLITINVFFYFFQLTKSTLFKLWHFWTGSVKQAWIICQWGFMCFFSFACNCIFYFTSGCFIDTYSQPILTSESKVGGLQGSTERTCFQVTKYHMCPFSDTHTYALEPLARQSMKPVLGNCFSHAPPPLPLFRSSYNVFSFHISRPCSVRKCCTTFISSSWKDWTKKDC